MPTIETLLTLASTALDLTLQLTFQAHGITEREPKTRDHIARAHTALTAAATELAKAAQAHDNAPPW